MEFPNAELLGSWDVTGGMSYGISHVQNEGMWNTRGCGISHGVPL